MKAPSVRVRRGLAVLGAATVVSVVGYRFLGERTWLDALYMYVITVATVGYGERSQLQPAEQAFTILVILVGIASFAYTFGAFVQHVAEGEINRVLGRRRMQRDIDHICDHVIICGWGRVGRILSHELERRRVPFLVIDDDPASIVDAAEHGYLCLQGDAQEEETLRAAHIERAKSVVSSLPSDAANVFITLTARDLNPHLQIIARAEQESSVKKLKQAGADRVVMPAVIGAQNMARMITRPSTADLIALVAESAVLDVDLDELLVTAGCKLAGRSVRETEANRRHRVLLVAVKKSSGAMLFNPSAEYVFEPDDVAIVMGRMEDIETFRKQFID